MQIKKWSSDSVWFLNGLMLGVATMILGLVLFSNWVNAATYNVLFNNVEQGANSTANPKVEVANGKATKSAGETAAVASETPVSPDVNVPVGETAPIGNGPIATDGVSRTAATEVAVPKDRARHPMRVGLSANRLGGKTAEDSNPVGGTLSLGYFPLRDVGLNLFAGSSGSAPHAFYGGEIEFVPVRAGIFGWENALEVKAMIGATTLGRDMGTHGHAGSILAGLGSTINFGERYGLGVGLRTNLSNRSDYQYWLADAGLTIRF